MFDTGAGDADDGWVTVDCDPGDDVGARLMVAPPRDRDLASRLGGIRRAVSALPGLVAPSSDGELIEALEQVQAVANGLAPVDQALLGEIERRGLPERFGFPRAAALLTGMLRVRPTEAKRRARASAVLAPRTDLLGQELPPVREQVARAQAQGVLSPDHADVIDRALTALPLATPPATVEDVETILVDYARQVDPSRLAVLGRIVRERFDPDGAEPRDAEIDRRRGLTLRQRDDGMAELRGVLTPECLAAVAAVLSPLAAPRPADDVVGPDPRSAPQRLHDALDDAAHRLLRSGAVPDSGGVPTSITVTMTLAQLRLGTGLAQTEHGGTVPVQRLLHDAVEAEYVPVVLDDAGGILSYGHTRRIAPPALARAVRARDKGCTVPGCSRPAAWTERHHIVEHRHGGPTSIDNLCLVCRYHHRSFERHGWSVRMIDGRPWWIPPPDVDPDRRPRRNTYWDNVDP